MKIPQFRECECGHLGGKHRLDGTCARCECKRFSMPVHLYARGERSSIPHKQIGARSQ